MSPLLYACQNSRVSLSQLLISVNADVNKQDSRGWTVRGGGGELMELGLEEGGR